MYGLDHRAAACVTDDIRRAGIETGRVDHADAAELRHLLRRHRRPGLTAVARYVHQAVVRSRPDEVGVGLARAIAKIVA